MHEEPLVRATWIRSFEASLSALGPASEAEVRARGRRQLDDLAACGVLDFAPLPLLVALEEHVLAVAGEAGLTLANRATMRAAARAPFLGNLVQGAISLFGATPGALVRMLPRSWAAFTRNAGHFSVELAADGRSAAVRCEHVPETLTSSRAYVLGWRGFFQGLCSIAGQEGDARVSREARAILAHVAW